MRLLGPAHDHDLGRLAAHAARGPQVLGDRLAQGLVAHGLPVAQQLAIAEARVAGDQARPDVERKRVDRRLAHAERGVSLEPGLDLRPERRGVARHQARRGANRRLVRPASRAGDRELVGHGARDEGARAHAALEVTLRQELFERIEDGDARNLELGREDARRRQALARAGAGGRRSRPGSPRRSGGAAAGPSRARRRSPEGSRPGPASWSHDSGHMHSVASGYCGRPLFAARLLSRAWTRPPEGAGRMEVW